VARGARGRVALALLGLALAGYGANRSRRRVVGRALGLPPARYRVAVERNLRIPMPDGVGLMADHYRPVARGRFPTILVRSGYGRGPELGTLGRLLSFPYQRFAERGYHVIVQTTRGRFDSEGEFAPFVDAAPDGRATLDWIARQPWFDGSLGMWGPSWLGYTQWAVAADAPPFLKAITPSLTSADLSSTVFPDGALALDLVLRWLALVDVMDSWQGKPPLWSLGATSPDAQEHRVGPAFRHLPLVETAAIALGKEVAHFREALDHPDAGDPYWRPRDHRSDLARVGAAVHLVTGWYDLLCRELLADYATLRAAGQSPYLTIGPWHHLALGAARTCLREGLIWLDAHLKGDRSRLRERPVRVYVLGAREWRDFECWPPPARAVRLYLGDQSRLLTEAPDTDSGPDGYCYDPADPTPAVGGPLFTRGAGPRDNWSLERRADVLCYTSRPLAADLEVIGPVRLELYVRSSRAHTDFFGRLCDVYPDGRSINICDGLCRVAPGTGERQPDGSLRLEIDLWATACRFRRGHRLRLQVSSGAHPRWSRNLGTGEPLGTGTRMAAAYQTVYHDAEHPSALVLPVAGQPGTRSARS
jgi:putative CocE/NonD family hydrolase